MKKIIIIILFLGFSFNLFSKEITCENKINSIQASFPDFGVDIGFPDLYKSIGLSLSAVPHETSGDFGRAYKQRILIDTENLTLKFKHKAFSNSNWHPTEFQLELLEENKSIYYFEIFKDKKDIYNKRYIWIHKKESFYTYINLEIGFEAIIRGECTIF